MSGVPELRTERLLLRGWRKSDRPAFAEMNADPAVMEFFPAALSRAESDAFVDRIEAHWAARPYGLWAVEVPGVAPFVGYVGLWDAVFPAPFTPTVEVGWRLARAAWGSGYATEGARATLAYGFPRRGPAGDRDVHGGGQHPVARGDGALGMVRDPAEDFDHPAVVDGHALRRHVLYRLPAAERAGYG